MPITYIILGIAILIILGQFVRLLASEGQSYYNLRVKEHSHLPRGKYKEYDQILEVYLPYYADLPPPGRAKFLKRLETLLGEKDVVGGKGFRVTETVRVRILATIVQLTFGLDRFAVQHFHTIIVMPDIFYLKLMDAKMKGGASPSGKVLLSWKHFDEGYEDPHDKINLGLHEMAHALHLDALMGRRADRAFQSFIDEWLALGHDEMIRLRHGRESFLRRYGGTNEKEFFAVAVEHFFEAPKEFAQRLPKLYQSLRFLLNQDPLAPENNYQLEKGFGAAARHALENVAMPAGKAERARPKLNWPTTVFGFGFTAGWVLTTFFWRLADVNFVFFIPAVLAAIFFFTYRPLVKSGYMDVGLYAVFSALGFFPAVTGLVMLLSLVPIGEITERHKVTSMQYVNREYHLTLEDNAYSHRPTFRVTTIQHMDRSEGPEDDEREAVITFHRGLALIRLHHRTELRFPEELEPTTSAPSEEEPTDEPC